MDFPILKQEDFLPDPETAKPRVSATDLPSFETATGGNPPVLDANDFVPDATKVADVYPLQAITDMPLGDLYNAHAEVKEGIQTKRDEGLIRSFQARYRQTDFGMRQSWLAYQELIGNHNPNFEMEMAKLDAQIMAEQKYVIDNGLFQKAVNSFASLLPTAIDVGKEGLRGGLVTGMAVGGTAVYLTPPAAPAAAATAFVAGSAAFSAKHMTELEAGSMYKELYNLKDSNGELIDPAVVKTFSMAVGVINGAIEAAQVKLLLKTIPGLDKVMSDVVKNSVIKLLKDGTVKTYLLSAAGRYAKFLAGETAQEVAQELVAIVGGEMAKEVHENLSDVTVPHSSWEEILDRIKETAVTSVLGFSFMGAPGHVMQVMPGLIDRKSQVVDVKLKEILPPDREINFDKEITNTFERIKNVFFGKRDTRIWKNKNDNRRMKKEFRLITPEGQSAEEAAIAVQLYIDSKNHPEAVEAALRGERLIEKTSAPFSSSFEGVKPTYETKPLSENKKLSDTQIRLIEMSKNLTKEQLEFANMIIKEYDAMAQEGIDAEVIFNTRNNFTNRSWVTNKKNRDAMSRLTGTTIHAKERRIPTIVEGWTEGLKMTSHSAIDNLTMYKDSMIKTMEQKRLITSLMNGKTVKGNPLLTTEKKSTYEQVNMPTYSLAGKRSMFAPRKIARNLNNIFGKSGLYDAAGIEQLTKLNALIKKIALSTSFFHNIAFMRSFYLGGRTMQWNNMNPFTAHREGVEMINNMDQIIELGVYNGLTLNIIQDWEEDLISMTSDIDRITNKYTKSKRVRGLVSNLWRRQVEFTFGVQGAGLKAKAFALEFLNEVDKNPNENVNKIASRVAMLMNADFGGLHLERIGRNPTTQHIFRLLALAPDWTESNIRTIVGMFGKEGGAKQRQLYRIFWLRVVLKSVSATTMMNVLLAGGDAGEAHKRWKAGVDADWKNVASLDITPIYNLFGMNPRDRKYFSIAGHFLDPAKYVADPYKSVQYKASMLGRMAKDLLFQENWQGKRFKNLAEIPLGVKEFTDYMNLDTYVTYKTPEEHGEFFKRHFSLPAYIMSEAIGSSPIAFQNLLAALSGEITAVDGVMNTLGVRQRKPRKKKGRGGR